MATTKRATTAKAKAAPAVREGLREQWEKELRTWKDLLPRRVKFGFEGSGLWAFQLADDEQKRAAGWEPAHSFQPGPDGSLVRVDHLAPPQALCSAAWVLADMARRLADRGAQLRVDGSRRLREFEHALRFSGGISRNPLLLWEDGVDDIVDDVLAAHEGSDAVVHVAPARRSVELDLVNDPGCKSIRDILRAGPKMRGAINKDSRLLCSPRQAGDLLNAMAEAGMVTQTKPRGPWRFVSDTPRH